MAPILYKYHSKNLIGFLKKAYRVMDIKDKPVST